MRPLSGTGCHRRARRELPLPRLVSLALLTALTAPACGEPGTTQDEASAPATGATPGTTTGGHPSFGASGGMTGAGASTGGTESGGLSGSGGTSGATATGGEPSGGGGAAFQPGESADALAQLQEWLAGAASERTELDSEDFATVPLTSADALAAKDLLWNDVADRIRETRSGEVDAKSITLDGFTLDYETVYLGDEPTDGRSLFISMHGGGSAPKATNDEQWQNQILLAESYAPKDALWIAPRAPTDDWNMWFKDHIVALFDRLISNMIVFEGIHPDRVYLTGYSAGGDGVYQLGPTLADRWAGAAMSAGHPNDMTPLNLRNLAFAIHVGGDDAAFDRNLVAADWGRQLDELQVADPDGYPHQVEVHAGLPHWMNLADQPSIPFIQSYTRDVYPQRLVWHQSTLLQTRFYWLQIEPEQALKDNDVIATIDGQTIALESDDLSDTTVLLSDQLLDLDQEVTLLLNGNPVFEGPVARTILALHRSLSDREDPGATFSAEVSTMP